MKTVLDQYAGEIVGRCVYCDRRVTVGDAGAMLLSVPDGVEPTIAHGRCFNESYGEWLDQLPAGFQKEA